MTSISLDKQINQYLPQLAIEEKKSILSQIKSFLKHKKTEASPQRLTIEQYNKELEEAEARIDAGHFYTQEEVEEMSKQW